MLTVEFETNGFWYVHKIWDLFHFGNCDWKGRQPNIAEFESGVLAPL